jgi:hypothetical protein
VTLFQLVKATSRRVVLLTPAGSNIARVMDFYLKKWVNFACLSNLNNIFPEPLKDFLIPPYNIKINTFKS